MTRRRNPSTFGNQAIRSVAQPALKNLKRLRLRLENDRPMSVSWVSEWAVAGPAQAWEIRALLPMNHQHKMAGGGLAGFKLERLVFQVRLMGDGGRAAGASFIAESGIESGVLLGTIPRAWSLVEDGKVLWPNAGGKAWHKFKQDGYTHKSVSLSESVSKIEQVLTKTAAKLAGK